MRLVIAEKPSVGRTIAQAISSSPEKKDGYIDCGQINGEHVLVSWAQGHLIDLADPKAYGSRWAKWTLDSLPVDPGSLFKWEISREKGAAGRYKALLPLMREADTLIDACDPDREGSGIFHRIIRQAGLEDTPALRLWANSMDADGIRQAWESMRPERETIGLAQASDARAKADWILGMTASRAYSLLYNRKCSIGRVETPTLAIVADRDQKIRDHVSTPYWTITIPLKGWTLTSQRIASQADAEIAIQQIPTTITLNRVERKNEQQKPPTLYDLTSLQRDANTEAGMTAGQTLTALQALYEAGLATYPRTDSRYITHDDASTLNQLLHDPLLADPRLTGTIAGDPAATNIGQTINDRKVEGHTALLPTSRLTAETWEKLPDSQKTIMRLIIRRMWEATGRPREHTSTKITATIGKTAYTATQDTTTAAGWATYKPTKKTGEDQAEQHIPDSLETGDVVLVQGTPSLAEGHTKPPRAYTDASLLSAMEHAGRLVDDQELRAAIDDDSIHSGGLGTPATRAAIIDKLVKNKYLARDGRKLTTTDEGRGLIQIVAPALKAIEATGRMEQGLSAIADGTAGEDEWLSTIHQQAQHILPDARAGYKPEYKQQEETAESFGPCPICGKPVIKTKSGYWKCSANRKKKQGDKWVPIAGACTYGIWKKTIGNNKKRLTDSLVRKTLGGETPIVKGAFHSKRTGKDYDLVLVPDRKWGIDGQFPERK